MEKMKNIISLSIFIVGLLFFHNSMAGHTCPQVMVSNTGSTYVNDRCTLNAPSGGYITQARADNLIVMGGSNGGQGYFVLCAGSANGSDTQCTTPALFWSNESNRAFPSLVLNDATPGDWTWADLTIYGLKVVQTTGDLSVSIQQTAPPPPPPPPPPSNPPGNFNIINQTGVVSNNDIIRCPNRPQANVSFNWTSSSGAALYRIFHKTWTTGAWGEVGTTTGTSFNHTGTYDAGNHYYVRAENTVGQTIANPGLPDGAEANCQVPTYSQSTYYSQSSYIYSQSSYTPSDTTRPIIANVKIININQASATVTWSTDELSDSQVRYCITPADCNINTPLDTNLVLNHSVNLLGLTPNTFYYIWAKSKDSSGNLRISGYYLFKTLSYSSPTPSPTNSVSPSPTPSPSAPIPSPIAISNIQVLNITRDSALVTWDTNQLSDSRVIICFARIFCYRTAAFDPTYVTAHSLVITGLKADSTVYIRVASDGASGNKGLSGTISFKTQPGLIISNTNTQLGRTSIMVSWDTNYPADSKVRVCRFPFVCLGATVSDPLLISNHLITVNNLLPGTRYYYQITSVDGSGYTAYNQNTYFTTLP